MHPGNGAGQGVEVFWLKDELIILTRWAIFKS
jgi:hypothetical protein